MAQQLIATVIMVLHMRIMDLFLVQTTYGGVTMDSMIVINQTTFEVHRVFAEDKTPADLISDRMKREQSQIIPLTAKVVQAYNQSDTIV